MCCTKFSAAHLLDVIAGRLVLVVVVVGEWMGGVDGRRGGGQLWLKWL